MSDLVTTQIRALTAPGTSQPVRAPNGSHVLTATVTGSGPVAAVLTWQGSNDLLGWVTLGTLSASGTGVAGGSASTTLDYAYWQVRLDSMTGAQCAVSIATAPAEDGSNSSPFTPAEAANLKGVVSADGNLAYAAVATTTGTPGEVRKLSDGPDKGAALTWAIPEGASAYAWCWQIYPLAAYL